MGGTVLIPSVEPRARELLDILKRKLKEKTLQAEGLLWAPRPEGLWDFGPSPLRDLPDLEEGLHALFRTAMEARHNLVALVVAEGALHWIGARVHLEGWEEVKA